MAASLLSNYIWQLHEFWLSGNMPAETYGEAGSLFTMLDKSNRQDDWQGTGEARMPVRNKLNGAIGNVAPKVFSNQVATQGEQFLIPNARHWAVLKILDRTLAFTKNREYLESRQSGLMDEMEQVAKSWMRATSYLLWGDGRHLLAKGDANYDVSTSTITFRNVDNTHKFEQGDIIRLVEEATAQGTAPGTLPTPRAGTLTVLSVSATGLVVDAAVNTIVGAVNTDYVTKDVYHDAGTSDDPDDSVPITGVFGFLAENETLANSTFYGVDRAQNPKRLAGLRVPLTGAETPWTICSKIMTTARTSGAKIDSIYVPSSQVESLMEELASRGISYREVTKPVTQAQNLVIGVTGVQVNWLSSTATIMDDRFLSDPDVTREDDKRYVGLYTSECLLKSSEKIGWKDYAGDGTPLDRISGTQTYAAEYGIFGNYAHTNPLNAIVAKAGADL